MAGLIPQSFIDELIARTDIVEVIGGRVQLKKAGREYKACCPFHNEKTPSFWVSPEKQFYHCFGCGAHGTALGFLMEHDHLPFPEAVEDLAGRLGLEVPREGGESQAKTRRADDSSIELLKQVAHFYSQNLARTPHAQRYLEQRGLNAAAVERFAIGYAPNSWNEVLKRFGTEESQRRQLLDVGLIIERDRAQAREGERYYDRFRDRVMFPIRDARGRVIAFGGRIIEQGEPKYLNSPETFLFHKGRELYGLYEARQTRGELQRLLVVEGYMDVVRLHQSGISYAVATLGTATTAEHLKRIFRLVSEVVFAFDGDRAGKAAAWRALQNVLPEAQEGREIRFLFLPEGHDPDTLVGLEGREAFESRIGKSATLAEYLIAELASRVEWKQTGGLARLANLVKPLIDQVPQGPYRKLLLARLGLYFKMGLEDVAKLLDTAAAHEPVRMSRAIGGGRGSLVQQAVEVLLNAPELASRVSEQQLEELAALEQANTAFFCELLRSLKQTPAQNAGQVLERFRDHPYAKHLERLAARELLISDRAALASQLIGTVQRLIEEEQHRQRFESLIEGEGEADRAER
jgi:DNA primase